jgi:hypothetical protein
MARMEQVQSITMEAGGDLSAAQFTFVEVAADGQVDQVSSAGGNAIGVLLNDPDAAGKAATVAYAGRVKVVIGTGDIVTGDVVQSDGSGAAIAATTADQVLGRCLVGGSAGELCEVLLYNAGIF